jgi:hypothetical protein
MRRPYAHDAVLEMPPDGDTGAPGAAITTELCGHWEHEPPCPLAAHHCAAARRGQELHLRILFAAEPADEAEVRRRIAAALAAGRLGGTTWTLLRAAAGAVRPDEASHAERLRA